MTCRATRHPRTSRTGLGKSKLNWCTLLLCYCQPPVIANAEANQATDVTTAVWLQMIDDREWSGKALMLWPLGRNRRLPGRCSRVGTRSLDAKEVSAVLFGGGKQQWLHPRGLRHVGLLGTPSEIAEHASEDEGRQHSKVFLR